MRILKCLFAIIYFLILFVLNSVVFSLLAVLLHIVCLPFLKQSRGLREGYYFLWHKLLASWLHLLVPDIKIHGDTKFTQPGNVLLMCNHLSWADIIAIYYATNRTWPMVKFMLKSSLAYEIPFCVLYCWLNDFPIIRRSALTRAKAEKNTDMRKALKQNIIDALNKTFANESSLILFCEGTRSTPEKLASTKTPHKFLLPAKTGGVAMGLTSMLKSKQPIQIVDLTLIYRGAQPSMTNILLGRIHRVEIHIEQVETPDWLAEDLLSTLPKRTRLKKWLLELWQAKDEKISKILAIR